MIKTLNKNTCQFDSCQGASRAAHRDAVRFPQVPVRINRLSTERLAYCRCWQRLWGVRWAPYHPHSIPKEQSPTGSIVGCIPPSQGLGNRDHHLITGSHGYARMGLRVPQVLDACTRGGGCIELCNCDVAWWPYERKKMMNSWFLRVNVISIGFLFQGEGKP